MTLEIIPVIDLLNGVVVHAKQGMRHLYQPLQSRIVEQTDVTTMCKTFISHYGLNRIYIADLNAINNSGCHTEIINPLFNTMPQIEIWLDGGLQNFNSNVVEPPRCTPVLGTETGFSLDDLETYKNRHSNLVLSLDFNAQGLLGNTELLNCPELWPQTIILMDLERVGSEAGINVDRIAMIQSKLLDSQRLYVAGGIRNNPDLIQLDSMGIDGALIASALHNQTIKLENIHT